MRSLYWAGCWAPVGILNRCGRSSIGIAAFTNFAKIGWCTLLVALLAGYSTASGFGHLLALLSGYVTALLPFNLVADILGHLLTNFSWHLVTLFSWHLVALLEQMDNIECLNSKKFQQNGLKANFKWQSMQIKNTLISNSYLIWQNFQGYHCYRALPFLYGGSLDLFRLNSAIQNSKQWLLSRSTFKFSFELFKWKKFAERIVILRKFRIQIKYFHFLHLSCNLSWNIPTLFSGDLNRIYL